MKKIIVVTCVILSLLVIQVEQVNAYTYEECKSASIDWLWALAEAAAVCYLCVRFPTPPVCLSCITLAERAVRLEARADYICSNVNDEPGPPPSS
ncbi:MAG: hypothetical protein ABH873_09470 [Candidatus Firestonebacteria bacterium]